MRKILNFGIIGLILMLTGIWSCNQNTSNGDKKGSTADSTANEALTGDNGKMVSQIMALHEKTMQDMDSLVDLKKQLKAVEASKTVLSGPDHDSIDANIKRLQKADDDMMDWMNQYNEPDKKMADDKAKAYLTDQLNKIEGVYAEIQNSMKNAKDYLKMNK